MDPPFAKRTRIKPRVRLCESGLDEIDPMPTPRVLILRAPGSNCDNELHYAFELAGGVAEKVHINRLRENPSLLKQFQILGIPGGFTYGDDVAAGKILAHQLAHYLSDAIRQFRDEEKLIL